MTDLKNRSIKMKQSSKIDWVVNLPENQKGNYPGDDNVQLGCLMRIADATEIMASEYTKLINDRDRFQKLYEQTAAEYANLLRKNQALKSVISRFKNQKKQWQNRS